MSGILIPLIAKQTFNFNAGAATIVAVKAQAVLPWREGALLVRVHEEDVASSSTIEVIARIIAPCPEEPDVDFIWTAADIAKVTINSSTTAPSLQRDDMLDDFGAFLQITVVGTPSGGNCVATISADLAVKA